MTTENPSPYKTLWTEGQDRLVKATLGHPERFKDAVETHGSVAAACRHLAERVSQVGPSRTGNAVFKRLETLGIVVPESLKAKQLDTLKEHWPNRPPSGAPQHKLISFYEGLQDALSQQGLSRTVSGIKQQAARLGLRATEQKDSPITPQPKPTAVGVQFGHVQQGIGLPSALAGISPSPWAPIEPQLTNRAIAILANGDRAKALLAFAQAGEVLGVIPEVTIKAFTEAFPGLQFHKAG